VLHYLPAKALQFFSKEMVGRCYNGRPHPFYSTILAAFPALSSAICRAGRSTSNLSFGPAEAEFKEQYFVVPSNASRSVDASFITIFEDSSRPHHDLCRLIL